MNFDKFKRVLKKIPISVSNNKESLICLDYDFRISSPDDFLSCIDSKDHYLEYKPTVILPPNRKVKAKLLSVAIEEPFYQLNFNNYLYDRFDLAKELFFKQSEIKNFIASQSSRHDFVMLIVVDGLSYLDCLDWDNVSPCLVDTVTTTKNGFKNIICNGSSLAYEMYQRRFRNFVGFSYWEKDQKNDLTDEIFRGFSSVSKFEAYSQVIEQLKEPFQSKTYFQIVMQGLDGIAHNNRDEPLIEAIVGNIRKRVQDTVKILSAHNKKGIIFLTSDHGILWKHKSSLVKIPSHSSQQHYHQRYYDSKILSKDCKCFSIAGGNYSSLRYPFITRVMRPNEWGVHGGISLEESVVPFVTISVN